MYCIIQNNSLYRNDSLDILFKDNMHSDLTVAYLNTVCVLKMHTEKAEIKSTYLCNNQWIYFCGILFSSGVKNRCLPPTTFCLRASNFSSLYEWFLYDSLYFRYLYIIVFFTLIYCFWFFPDQFFSASDSSRGNIYCYILIGKKSRGMEDNAKILYIFIIYPVSSIDPV